MALYYITSLRIQSISIVFIHSQWRRLVMSVSWKIQLNSGAIPQCLFFSLLIYICWVLLLIRTIPIERQNSFFHLTIRHNEREGEREKEKARKNYFAAVIVGILLLVWWQLLNKNVRKNKKLRYFFVCWSYLSTVFYPPEHFIYKYICHTKKNVPQLLQFEIRSFSIDIFNSFFVRLSFGRSSFSVCHFLKMFS